MGFLSAKDIAAIKDMFDKSLVEPVKIVYFTQQLECQYCRETHQILEEVVNCSDKLSLEVHNYLVDKEKAQEFNIDKIPAIVVMRDGANPKDYGMRFYGIPSGYEFMSLLESIKMASTGQSDLSDKTLELISRITTPIHIQVFVTPTCPYCPRAVMLGYKLAVAHEQIRSDGIEAIEFPHLANRYRVQAVPKIVINDQVEFEGALPENMFVEYVLLAAGVEPNS